MLRMIIADDHEVVRQSLIQLLREEFSPAHFEEAEDAQMLIEKVRLASWDMVITDLAMPGGGGLEALKAIRKTHANLPVIVISTYPAEQYANRVLRAGAQAYVCKDALPGELLQAVYQIINATKADPR